MTIRPLVVLTLLLPLTGCALSHVMPPFAATRSAAAAADTPSAAPILPSPRVFEHRKPIAREYDTATDQTRVSVTTHEGVYFLWIQRPRLTFFYVHYGATLEHAPASVFLVFRTLDPQLPLHNRLDVECDGVHTELPITPTFWLEPGAMTTSRHYMYELLLAEFAPIVACGSATVAVGQVRAPFNGEQLEALRDFATRLRAP